jgi:hypothetical protein
MDKFTLGHHVFLYQSHIKCNSTRKPRAFRRKLRSTVVPHRHTIQNAVNKVRRHINRQTKTATSSINRNKTTPHMGRGRRQEKSWCPVHPKISYWVWAIMSVEGVGTFSASSVTCVNKLHFMTDFERQWPVRCSCTVEGPNPDTAVKNYVRTFLSVYLN